MEKKRERDLPPPFSPASPHPSPNFLPPPPLIGSLAGKCAIISCLTWASFPRRWWIGPRSQQLRHGHTGEVTTAFSTSIQEPGSLPGHASMSGQAAALRLSIVASASCTSSSRSATSARSSVMSMFAFCGSPGEAVGMGENTSYRKRGSKSGAPRTSLHPTYHRHPKARFFRGEEGWT